MQLHAAQRRRHPSPTATTHFPHESIGSTCPSASAGRRELLKILCTWEATHQATHHDSQQQNINRANRCFAGSVLGHPSQVQIILRDHLVSLWSNRGAKNIYVHENGSFIVEFFNSQDRHNVFTASPWWFFDRPLQLLSFSPGFSVNKKETETIPLWIQIRKIPEDCFNEGDIRRGAAAAIGHPLKIQLGSAFTARVKVLYPTNNPAIGSIMIKNHSGEGYVVPVKYGLHFICTSCRSILHRVEDCPRNQMVPENTNPTLYSSKLLSGNNDSKEIEQPQQKAKKIYPWPIPLQQHPRFQPNPSSHPARINMCSPGTQPRKEEDGQKTLMAGPEKSLEKIKGKKRKTQAFVQGSDDADELEWENFRPFIRDFIRRSKSPGKALEEMIAWVREVCDKIEKESVKAVEQA